ncbi:MAG: endonuclease III [Clostridiales Family XIII bacterium]|jgi:endonuclease-3|nr:endonuclease III [Clostridiales Family XIII bacterium]
MTKKLLTKNEIAEVMDRLEVAYPDAECALVHGSVFELIVAVALSAQTTDVSVNKVTPELFRRWPTPEALASANPDEVAEVIRTIGMYKTKSKNIVGLAQKIAYEFGGEVPADFSLLTSLPGVGRKTANVVLAVWFGEDRIAVDTHVFRVSNRIGLVSEPTPDKVEVALTKKLPKGTLAKSHHCLIWHGRRICHARKPDCANCTIEDICLKKGL